MCWLCAGKTAAGLGAGLGSISSKHFSLGAVETLCTIPLSSWAASCPARLWCASCLLALPCRLLLGCPELSPVVLGPAAVLQPGGACTASSGWRCSCIDTADWFVLVGHSHTHPSVAVGLCVSEILT